MRVRDVLNEVKWRLDRLEDVEITYRHRGAPRSKRSVERRETDRLRGRKRGPRDALGAKDERTVSGRDLRDVGRSFLRFDDASIPHHRVLRIELDGRTIWER